MTRMHRATRPADQLALRTAPMAKPGAARAAAGVVLADDTMLTRVLTDREGAPLHLRALADAEGDGSFDGYACVWDVIDAYGTRFRRGCFSAGGLDTDPYALLWMHSPWEVLGIFYATEDDHGLHIVGRWDDTPEGQAARAKAKSGSAPGLSVGFVPVATNPDDDDEFVVARLVETSQITARMAAVPGATLVGVRGTTGQPEQDAPPEAVTTDDAAAQAIRVATARLLLAEPVRR